jgi:hypothetical protein
MRATFILTATLLLSQPAHAAPDPLEQALRKAKTGLEGARVERTKDNVTVAFKYGDKTLDEPRLRKTVLAAMVVIKATAEEVKHARFQIEFADGHVMQVAGDPGGFWAEMDEVNFLRAARVQFRTRGPSATVGPCLLARRMTCKRNPERCPCEPGSMCEPAEQAADKRGCLAVRASRNAVTSGSRTMCKPGHTWNPKGHDCVPIPDCGEAGLEHGGECICPPGVKRSSSGGCGPVPGVAPDAGPPDAGPTSRPVVVKKEPSKAAAAAAGLEGFPRWVWQAMAIGVGLSVPISLFLIGSLISGWRSKRSRIGLMKFCIHCGRRLDMEDTECKCGTQQP